MVSRFTAAFALRCRFDGTGARFFLWGIIVLLRHAGLTEALPRRCGVAPAAEIADSQRFAIGSDAALNAVTEYFTSSRLEGA